MMLCRIRGSVVSTVKNEHLCHNKLLMCEPVDLDGERKVGPGFLALDRVQAGPGDLVLIVNEGSSARGVFQNPKIPLTAFTVAIVDDLEVIDEARLLGQSVAERSREERAES
jgi:microcompartment protein CcmK/EutM